MARFLLHVALVAATSLLVCEPAVAVVESEKYSDKYDYIDVDGVLANDRLRQQYYNCFFDDKACLTPDALFFKERFPDALMTKCRKCTDKQRAAFEKIAVWFSENDPEAWEAVIRKGLSDFQRRAADKAAREAAAAEAEA